MINEDNNNQSKHIELNPEQLDALLEIGNIGSGNAITALSKLLDKKIEMSLTCVNLIPYWELPTLLGDPSTQVLAINSTIKNQENLSILQFFTKDSILSLLKILNPDTNVQIEDIARIEDLDEYSLSIITETGSILAGHYCSSLANLMSTKLIPDVPLIAFDVIGAITSCLTARFCQNVDYSIIIDTKLGIEDINLDGTFCFFTDFNTLGKFFKSLEIECIF